MNIVNHATYTKDEVDADKADELVENNTVTINFTPNQGIPVTEYRVYSGSWNESDKKLEKDANTLVLDNQNYYLADPITLETKVTPGRVHVPEAYTDYNNNTYGCYKQKVGDANIQTSSNKLAESEADIYWDHTTDENGNTVVDHTKVTKVYHVDLSNLTNLLLPTDESRYLLRIWRQVEGDDEKVLLNDISSEFDPTGSGEDFELEGSSLKTAYHDMDGLVYDNKENQLITPISDTFYHHKLAEGTKITYYATLYVYDEKAEKYYVKKAQVTVSATGMGVITGIDELPMGTKMVRSMEYYNVAGAMSEKPFDGVNIVVARYTDGTTSTYKVIYPTK